MTSSDARPGPAPDPAPGPGPATVPAPDPGPATATASSPPTLADLDWPVRTERLLLRPARPEDAAAIWPWYQRPDVQEWTTTLSATLGDHQRWWDARVEQSVMGERDGEIVAAGLVTRQDAWGQTDVLEQARGRQAELGWVLHPGHHGAGLGTEFAAALLELAFTGLGVRRVVAECFAENIGSRRVMEKIGLRHEATTRQDSLHRSGRWLDGMSYALLASEYAARG